MARIRFADVPFSDRIKRAAYGGSPVIVKNALDATATLYDAITGTGTLTNSQTLNDKTLARGLLGWLEPGEYKITASGAPDQSFDTGAYGDGVAFAVPSDDLLGVTNVCPQECVPSVAATTTSQTMKFVRIVPTKKIVAAKVVLISGTAAS